MLEVGFAQPVVAGYEIHGVGEVGGVGALGLHVAGYGRGFAAGAEEDGEFEEAGGDFGAGEVADVAFEVEEMGEELLAGELEAVVVD